MNAHNSKICTYPHNQNNHLLFSTFLFPSLSPFPPANLHVSANHTLHCSLFSSGSQFLSPFLPRITEFGRSICRQNNNLMTGNQAGFSWWKEWNTTIFAIFREAIRKPLASRQTFCYKKLLTSASSKIPFPWISSYYFSLEISKKYEHGNKVAFLSLLSFICMGCKWSFFSWESKFGRDWGKVGEIEIQNGRIHFRFLAALVLEFALHPCMPHEASRISCFIARQVPVKNVYSLN